MVRAKFKCLEKQQAENGDAELHFQAVTSGSPENDSFFRYTPWGDLRFNTINAAVAAQFEEGKEYYVDLTPCAEAIDLEAALSPVSDEPNQDFD